MRGKTLFAVDDPNIPAAYRRRLRKQFRLEITPGGAEGLQAMERQEPFAVIVSDLRTVQEFRQAQRRARTDPVRGSQRLRIEIRRPGAW